MTEQKGLKIKIRGGHKARCTTLCNLLEESLSGGNAQEAWVRGTLEVIVRQKEKILALDDEIVAK